MAKKSSAATKPSSLWWLLGAVALVAVAAAVAGVLTMRAAAEGRADASHIELPARWVQQALAVGFLPLLDVIEWLKPAPMRVYELSNAYQKTAILGAVVKLLLPDLVPMSSGDEAAAVTVEWLAAQSKTRGDELYRLLRGAASIGIFREYSGRRFGHTATSLALRSEVANPLWPFALEFSTHHYRAWAALDETVKSGRPAFDVLWGRPFFEHLAATPAEEAVFAQAMTSVSRMTLDALIADWDWRQYGNGTVCDVGGSFGSFLAPVLAANPRLAAILFDQPSVIRKAAQQPPWSDGAAGDVARRTRLVEGDFFQAVPADADLYLMRMILHDWSDDQSLRILQTVRRAIADGARRDARLLIVEVVLPPEGSQGDTFPIATKLMDLNMMAMLAGKERTELQWRDLLSRAGFTLQRVTPTRSVFSFLEAVPTAA